MANFLVYNNTIIGNGTTTHGIKCSGTGQALIKNCLVQGCVTADFDPIADADLFSCTSEDTSTAGGTDCNQKTIIFKNSTNNNYLLDPRADDEAVSLGEDLSSDDDYSFDTDIIGGSIDDTWPIGAYHYTRELCVAIGNPVSDLKTGAPSASITSGILTFTQAQLNSSLCKGCVVTFADSDKYILCEKVEHVSNTQWIITKNDSTNQGRGNFSKALTLVTSVQPTFKDLYDAVEAEDGFSVPGIARLNDGSYNFVSTDLKVNIYCSYGTSTRNFQTAANTTFDETRTLLISTPANEGLDCNSRRRHSGMFDDSLWNNSCSMSVSCGYTTIEGLQIESSDFGIEITDGAHYVIKNNIIKLCTGDGIKINSSYEIKKIVVVNNLIYRCGGVGINVLHELYSLADTYVYLYSNTLDRNGNGIRVESYPNKPFTNMVFGKNNLEQNSVDRGYSSTTYNPKYVSFNSCWGGDSSLSKFIGKNNQPIQSIKFRDGEVDNYNIHFATSIVMIGAIELFADGDYYFSDDLGGRDRNDLKWDIGCNNFSISTEKIANFSLGMSYPNNLNTSTGLQASIHNGVLVFSNTDMSSSIGVGDKVTLDNLQEAYLAEKGNNYTWIVRDNAGIKSVDALLQDVVSITRVTATVNGIMTEVYNKFGSYNLVSAQTSVNVWCYKDDIDNDDPGAANIYGWAGNDTYKMRILTPWDTYTQSNSKHRHSGVSDSTGFKIKSSTFGISIGSCPGLSVEGLIVESTSRSNYGIGIGDYLGSNEIIGNIISDADYGVKQMASSSGNLSIINNIIYNVNNGIKSLKGFVYNNTVVDAKNSGTGIGIEVGGVDISLKNNIAYDCDIDYSGFFTIFDNCISKDSTGSLSYRGITLEFLDSDNKNYHLSRADWIAFNRGLDLTYDSDFSFNYDVDMEFIYPSDLNCWSIGADSVANSEIIKLYFSSSKNSAELKTGISPEIYITGGIAEFSEDQTNDNLGVGCVVDYDTDNKQCYLYEKIDLNTWAVRTAGGSIPKDTASVILNSIKHKYGELGFAIPGISLLLANGIHNFESLVDARYQINIPLYKGSNHVQFVDVSATYIANENHYLKIYTPIDIVRECNSIQRHCGVYNAGLVELNTIGDALTINNDSTVIEGLVIRADTNSGVVLSATSKNSKIIGNIVKNCSTGIKNLNTIGRNILVNNIVYDCSSDGIITGDIDLVYNNTTVGCTGYGVRNTATATLINNVSAHSGIGDYFSSAVIEYCLSMDSSAGINNNCVNDPGITFQDYPNKNFRLGVYDAIARNLGKQLSGNQLFKFSYDASMLQRGERWSVGALKFEPKRVFYSVGTAADVRTGSPLFSIALRDYDGASILTFDIPQTGDGIGVGCTILSNDHNFTNGCLIKEKITTSQWVVTDNIGNQVETVTDKAVMQIGRMYPTISSALSDLISITGGNNFISLQLQVNIACYNDFNYPDESSASISDLYCDRDCNLKIYTPFDTVSEVNKKQRHGGVFGAGYQLSPSSHYNNYAINISNSAYVNISGLTISNVGMVLSQCPNYSIVGNIVKDIVGNGIDVDTIVNTDFYKSNDFIINNLVYNCSGDGIIAGTYEEKNFYYSNTRIWNNTVDSCKHGIHFRRNEENPTNVSMINNICQRNYFQDFAISWSLASGLITLSHCVSRDGSADLYEDNLNYINENVEFINRSSGVFELNSYKDFSSIDTASDLSDNADYALLTDLALRVREPGLWERGALELSELFGYGELNIVAITTSGNAVASNKPPLFVIHLRESVDSFIDSVSSSFQFTSISDLNAFLNDNTYYDSYNLEIDVEANVIFVGKFSFRNRASRYVYVRTYPVELNRGPASLKYDTGLIDDTSLQSLVTFEDLKIYSINEMSSDYLVSTTAATEKIKFVNCIVQLNKHAVVKTANGIIYAFNSIFIYRNNFENDFLYLADNTKTGNLIVNSMVLCWGCIDITFITCNAESNDEVHNTLSYNYYLPNKLFLGNTGKTFKCMENTNPMLEEIG
jgi:hypothetical protein